MSKKQTVYFLSGLPASGKSTWAREQVRLSDGKTKRINKDDLRAMLDDSVFSKSNEKFVLAARDSLISQTLDAGYDVIVDDTNFALYHYRTVNGIVDMLSGGRDVVIERVFFDTPVEECIRRDAQRAKPVGEKVIRKMYNQYLRKEEALRVKAHNPDLPDCIVVDVDGTLALRVDREPFDYEKVVSDRINKPILDLLASLQNSHVLAKTIVMTGRENKPLAVGDVKSMTEEWLARHDVRYKDIYIREHKDHRPDWQVKEELYRTHIEGKYNVLYWIDDRDQVVKHMRSLGLTVLQVANGDF